MKKIKVKWRIANQEVVWRMYDEEGRPVIGKDVNGKPYHLGQSSSSVESMKTDAESFFWQNRLEKAYPDTRVFVYEYTPPEPERINIAVYWSQEDNELAWHFKGITGEVLGVGSGSACQVSNEEITSGFFALYPEVSPDLVDFTFHRLESKSEFQKDLEALLVKHNYEPIFAAYLNQVLQAGGSLLRLKLNPKTNNL